jgi:hypothetical protein
MRYARILRKKDSANMVIDVFSLMEIMNLLREDLK